MLRNIESVGGSVGIMGGSVGHALSASIDCQCVCLRRPAAGGSGWRVWCCVCACLHACVLMFGACVRVSVQDYLYTIRGGSLHSGPHHNLSLLTFFFFYFYFQFLHSLFLQFFLHFISLNYFFPLFLTRFLLSILLCRCINTIFKELFIIDVIKSIQESESCTKSPLPLLQRGQVHGCHLAPGIIFSACRCTCCSRSRLPRWDGHTGDELLYFGCNIHCEYFYEHHLFRELEGCINIHR